MHRLLVAQMSRDPEAFVQGQIAGIGIIIEMAKRSADALKPRAEHQPIRYETTIAALEALAEEGERLAEAILGQPAEPVAGSAPARARDGVEQACDQV